MTEMRLAFILALVIGIPAAIYTNFVQAQAAPPNLVCEAPAPLTYLLTYRKCSFSVDEPYGPPGFDQAYTVGFALPEPVPHNNSVPVYMGQAGYGDWTGAPTAGDPVFGAINIKNVPDFYPKESEHRLPNGIAPLGWGCGYFGDSTMQRYAASLDYVKANWNDSVDWNAGIRMAGTSYGASTVECQAVLLRPDWQSQVTVIDSMLGPSMSALAPGGLIERRADGWMAMGTPTQAYVRTPEMDAADPFLHLDRLRFVYFNFKAASNDGSTYTSIPVLKAFCDSGMACRAVWGNQNHALPPASLGTEWIKTFSSIEQSVRLDDLALIVFQKSSANDYSAVGNINGGLRWNSAAESETATTLTESIGYQRTFGLYANEPDTAKVEVLIRLRAAQMKLVAGDIVEWTFRGETGRMISLKNGEVFIPVSIPSGAGFHNLTITKTHERVPGC